MLEERLGRDAAPVEARAAERGRALDAGRPEAQLGGADGRHVATGAGADDHDVVSFAKIAMISQDADGGRPGHAPGRGCRPAGGLRADYIGACAPDVHEAQDPPHRRRRRGHARHAHRDPAPRLHGADRADRRGRARHAGARRRRPDAPRRAAAERSAASTCCDHQGAVPAHRGHRHLGGERGRDRGPGDQAGRLPLHHQGLRVRRAALAGAQRQREAGPQPPGRVAGRAGRRASTASATSSPARAR